MKCLNKFFFFQFWTLYFVRSRNCFLYLYRSVVICYTANPAGIYLFKVNNRNTRASCEICWKVNNRNTRTRREICSRFTIKTPERFQSLSLTMNRWMPTGNASTLLNVFIVLSHVLWVSKYLVSCSRYFQMCFQGSFFKMLIPNFSFSFIRCN